MNEHLEDLNDLFHALAGEVQDVAPLARARLRKTRIRRASVAGALALTVAAAGAAGALVAFGPGRDAGAKLGPAGTPQASVPPPPRPMHGELEAWGATRSGVRYWVTVYEDEGDVICMDLEQDSIASRPYCKAFEHDRAIFTTQSVAGRSDSFVYGWIPEGDNEVTLARAHGDDRRVATWPAPPGVKDPVRFFVITHLPRDVEGFYATVNGHSELSILTPRPHESNAFSFVEEGPNVDLDVADCIRHRGHEPLKDCIYHLVVHLNGKPRWEAKK